GLCRSHSRSSAAAAIAVLVRADGGITGGARGVEADPRRLSLQSGPGTAVDSHRGAKPRGEPQRRDRPDRALRAAPAAGRAADAGRKVAASLALRGRAGGGTARVAVVDARGQLDR